MQVRSEVRSDVVVVSVVSKRVDASLAREFLVSVSTAYAGTPRVLVLDLSAVDFLDSSGLGAVVGLKKRIGSDMLLVVAGLNTRLATLFRLTHVDRVLTTYRTVDEALAAVETA